MKRMFLTVAMCALGIADAQTPTQTPAREAPVVEGASRGSRFGAIDRVPIPSKVLNPPRDEAVTAFLVSHSRQPASPADEQEVLADQQKRICRGLHNLVEQAVLDRAKNELGVSVTDAEVEALPYRKQVLATSIYDGSADWARTQERTRTLIGGLTSVYDQGQEPQQVYQEQDIASHGISQQEWLREVYTHRTKEDRARLAQMLTWTPDTFVKASANINYRGMAEKQKLDATVDQQIAATDPTFRTYLAEIEKKVQYPAPGQTTMNLIGDEVKHNQYLNNKRAAWWQAENTKLQVTLSDPTLYSGCSLSAAVPFHVTGPIEGLPMPKR
jgi:hypothetical protein